MSTETKKISRVFKDFDLGFTKNSITSDLSKKTDVAAVKQSIRILLMTNFYERPFAYNKAANLRSFLFEQTDNLTAEAIRKNIQQVIESYEPRVIIQELNVTVGSDENSYDVYLQFKVVGFPLPQTLTANLTRLR